MKVHTKILFFELALGAFLRFLNLLYFHTLDTDEAIYAQAVSALTKGYVPYRDVFFAHPPVYLYLEYGILSANHSLLALRSFNVVLGVVITVLVYEICKLAYSERAALIASGIYALYPLAIYSNKIAFVDNGLTLFTTLMMLLCLKYLKENKTKYIALSGLFAGVSLMTKYTAILIVGALTLFLMFTLLRKKLKHFAIYVSCALVFPVMTFLLLLQTNIWPFFYEQTIHWQTIRFGMPAIEKFWFFVVILFSLAPMLIPAMLAIPDNVGDRTWQLMMGWVFIPLAAMPFSKVVFLQYCFSLIPPLCILVARGLERNIPTDFSFKSGIQRALKFKTIKKKIIPLLDITLALFYISMIFGFSTFSYGTRWFLVDNIKGDTTSATLTQNQIDLGNYIRNLTTPRDKIWTTEASIAFFAERIIVAPNSTFWKFQGFFQDVWAYSWTRDDYRGPIPGYSEGLITLNDILTAWQTEKPKVILFFPTSVVDQFIWNGIKNAYTFQKGLADYVISNYHLAKISEFQNAEIWIRNSPST